MKTAGRFLTVLLALSIPFLISGQSIHFVTTSLDDGPGSLRSVLQEADPFDTIFFNADIDSVFLTSGELLIDKSINIIGNLDTTIVHRSTKTSGEFRIIRVSAEDSCSIYLELLELHRGKAPDGTNEAMEGEPGGGIFIPDSNHMIRLKSCIISNNYAGNGYGSSLIDDGGTGGNGGGIYSNSEMRLENCRISNNTAGMGADWFSGTGFFYSHLSASSGSGGGIYSTNDLTLHNSRLEDNKARDGIAMYDGGDSHCSHSSGGDGGLGGGICCKDGMLHIENCEIVNNHSGEGGYTSNIYSSNSGAGGHGGGIYLLDSEAVIIGSEILDNYSGKGGTASSDDAAYAGRAGSGGGLYFKGESLTIMNSVISGNRTGNGGQVYFWVGSGSDGGHGGGAYINADRMIIKDCSIEGNRTGAGSWTSLYEMRDGDGGSGGGLWLKGGSDSILVSNTIIRANTTGNGGRFTHGDYKNGGNGGHGGGLYLSSGMKRFYLINCEVSGNRTGSSMVYEDVNYQNDQYPRSGGGGGICINSGEANLINVTCAGNTLGASLNDTIPITPSNDLWEKTRGKGGGMHLNTGGAEVVNSLFAFNTIGDTVFSNDLEGPVMMDYSFVRDSNNAFITGQNNIFNMDPYFVFFPDTLHITSISWAIDNGNPDTSMLNLPMTDLSGNPRIFNDRIDMGAYEYQGFTWQNLEISPDIIEFEAILPGEASTDTLTIINTGLQAVMIDSLYCFGPFTIWCCEDSAWHECVADILLSPYPPDNVLKYPLRFSTDDFGTHTEALHLNTSIGQLTVDLTGQCVDDSGVEEYSLSESIYPNPSEGVFWIDLPGLEEIEISDIFGRKAPFRSDCFLEHTRVQLVNPMQGIYLLNGKADGRYFKGKVLIGPAKK